MECAIIILIILVLYAIGKSRRKRTKGDGSSARASATLSGSQSVSPKITPPDLRPLASLEWSDLYMEVSDDFLQKLDAAHEKGFRSYVESMPDWQGSATDRQKASNAMGNLYRGLRRSEGPDYEDPFIAGAYQIQYQLSHCVMAFRIYEAMFQKISVIPNKLFICDFAAGSDAGLIGLMLSLEKRRANPCVRYMSIEPSEAMHKAGCCFRDNFEPWKKYMNDINYTWYKNPDRLSNLYKQKPDLKILTAFHLNLKYDYYCVSDVNDPFQLVMDSIFPDIYLCTCHDKKSKHLEYILDRCSKINPKGSKKCKLLSPLQDSVSKIYPDLASNFGFDFPQVSESYYPKKENLVKNRFRTPQAAELHYGSCSMKVVFGDDDDSSS